MLGEAELNSLEGQLSKFTFATKARQDALEQLTSSYGKLLDDYRALRSDFEEEKESREKYKKLARGQERNPFVLVLVDADGYVVSLHIFYTSSRCSFCCKCTAESYWALGKLPSQGAVGQASSGFFCAQGPQSQ